MNAQKLDLVAVGNNMIVHIEYDVGLLMTGASGEENPVGFFWSHRDPPYSCPSLDDHQCLLHSRSTYCRIISSGIDADVISILKQLDIIWKEQLCPKIMKKMKFRTFWTFLKI